MTRLSVGWTLLAALTTSACQQNYLCTLDDPPSLLIKARSSIDGTYLTGLGGTVTSKGYVLPIGCVTGDTGDECNMHARGATADIHLEREGYADWDTVNVKLSWSGTEGCVKPILKRVEAVMEPVE
jgi:hypothetical protein